MLQEVSVGGDTYPLDISIGELEETMLRVKWLSADKHEH